MKKSIKRIGLLGVLVGSLWADKAYAQLVPVPSPPGTASGFLPDVIFDLVTYALILVGIIAVAALIYGGFRYISAVGNEEQIGEAKRIILYAIIGIVVIGIAAVVVNFVIVGVGGTAPPAGPIPVPGP
jgi:heme/copper-type cytochrome/quinol oxidase subunit 2